ncbi:hypothetical protein VOA_001369 [Vibrio sp. RC586]|nr:hypothetical protein VOA_001369 [Vibrio sp. RC586]
MYIKPSFQLGLMFDFPLPVTQQPRYTKPPKIFTFQRDSVTPT